MRVMATSVLLVTCLVSGSAGAEQAATPRPSAASSIDDVSIAQPWTGDLDGMIERRMIRVLLPYSKTHYFIDKGTQRGVTYEALKQFEAL